MSGNCLIINDDEKLIAEEIVNQEIENIRKKEIKSKQDKQSRDKFLKSFDECLKDIKKDDQQYSKFLKNVLLSREFVTTKKIPMEYLKYVLQILKYNLHFSYRPFTHFPEIRTLCIALNYEQWEDVLNTIQVFRGKHSFKYNSEEASSAVLVTDHNKELRIEFCQEHNRLHQISYFENNFGQEQKDVEKKVEGNSQNEEPLFDAFLDFNDNLYEDFGESVFSIPTFENDLLLL